jgi:cold shock CspA family protein
MRTFLSLKNKIMTNDNQILGNIPVGEKIKGKIIYVNQERGWGFINSPDVKFTRIFFHWTGLEQATKHFTEVEKGMDVEFKLVQLSDEETGQNKFRAIKIKVV